MRTMLRAFSHAGFKKDDDALPQTPPSLSHHCGSLHGHTRPVMKMIYHHLIFKCKNGKMQRYYYALLVFFLYDCQMRDWMYTALPPASSG